MFKKFIILSCLTFLMACSTKQEAPTAASFPEQPPIPVLAIPPEIKDVPVYIESIGTLQPAVSLEIRPQVKGTLDEVLISEGDWVQMDMPLFKIDPKPYLIKVNEAKAQIAIAQAQLSSIHKKLNRYKSLAEKDLVAQIEWDELESQADTAQATLELNQVALNAAELDLERCTIYSPLKGRVGKLDAHPGQLVDGTSTVLATICQLDPLITEFTLTELELPKLSQHSQEAEIQMLHTAPNDTSNTKAKITFLDNHFDPKTGLLLVRGKVENPNMEFRPGQSIRVRIPVAIDANVKLIPQKAIRYNEQGPYVYTVQADKSVAFRQVTLGNELGNQVIVLEGIDPTELVITDGHLRLSMGSKVDVKS